jgi:hypothetical protein
VKNFNYIVYVGHWQAKPNKGIEGMKARSLPQQKTNTWISLISPKLERYPILKQ